MTSRIARLAAIVLSVLALLAETSLANTPMLLHRTRVFPLKRLRRSSRPVWATPANFVEVSIESGRAVEGGFDAQGPGRTAAAGRDAASYSTGQLRDLTSKVTYEIDPAGIVAVSPSGYVVPAGDGTTTITATSEAAQMAHRAGTIKVTVSHFGNDPLVNFPNQIVPIFTKLGCNGGGCHGKASGQNGFKLSLLGFEPTEDFEHLVKEGRGRRLFPAAPDKSLLLLKADRRRAARRRHAAGSRHACLSPDASLDPAGHALRQRHRPDRRADRGASRTSGRCRRTASSNCW